MRGRRRQRRDAVALRLRVVRFTTMYPSKLTSSHTAAGRHLMRLTDGFMVERER